ncbi:MAG TPA: deoxyribonuclease V [Anaerolineae bacterium]|nr:deoxyribonuclease V [Anaerolineae bacterium]HQI84822.1 deoxyribonuclease V [Anaerolineae bacterium]
MWHKNGLKITHPWNLDPPAAIALQRELADKVIREIAFGAINTVAGVDASYREGLTWAAIVVFNFPGMDILDYVTVERPVDYPYVPGLLSFREAPAVLDGLEKLATVPDLLIFDGHGIAHPRRLGIASHVGLLLDIPSIGCAKKRLVGQYDEPGRERGSFTYVREGKEIIGAAVRTRSGVQPVFVSIGHRVSLDAAIDIVLVCGRGYRLPEPTRWADRIADGAEPQTHRRHSVAAQLSFDKA